MRIEINGQEIWREITIANRFFKRFVGLMGKKSLGEEEGLLIMKCNQIHTFNMRFSIDVIYLSQTMEVIQIDTVPPGKIGPFIKGAACVLEVSAGSAEKRGVVVGTRLRVT